MSNNKPSIFSSSNTSNNANNAATTPQVQTVSQFGGSKPLSNANVASNSNIFSFGSNNASMGHSQPQQQAQSIFTNAQVSQQQQAPQQQAQSIFTNANVFQQQQQAPQQPSLFSNAWVAQQQQQQVPQQQPQFGIFSQAPQPNNAQQQYASNQGSLFGAPYPSYSNVNSNVFNSYPAPYVQQPVYGGYSMFGNQHLPQPAPQDPAQLYNDDEPLIEKAKQEHKQSKIELQMRAQRSLVKLKTQTELPAMITLKSSGGSRTSVDLICVIDNSGSMGGAKIQLVKSTVKFLLETLTPADRLSIITFNNSGNRLCGLKCVTGENMQTFHNIVDNINAGGGTHINSGLNLALKTIRDRKYINKVTSIFLLSDGQDKGAEITFKDTLKLPLNNQLGIFTLHSFGFGSDHDEELMTKLCEVKDGAFYYIKELSTLDEAFCNALGGIISVVANEVIIKLNNVAKNIVQGVKIKKVYGKMWEKISDTEYKIKILQLMSGITKDFVFELEIPNINTEVGDLDRDHTIMEAIFTAKNLSNQNKDGECTLQLTLLNKDENIPDTVENVDVIENYLRVKAAEAIEQNLKKADQQQYAQAQKGIDTMIQCIQSNPKARKQKMNNLLTDLNQIKQKCSPQQYVEARKVMMSAQNSHSNQNNFSYCNNVQMAMVQNLQAMKPGFNQQQHP